ncbi:uncharacterized protein [Chironomus tepperi]|uniref:uncharacterized protein n=1 Tax=Chironomus tepperi TaxID=113505 RepID=UPI00391F93F2
MESIEYLEEYADVIDMMDDIVDEDYEEQSQAKYKKGVECVLTKDEEKEITEWLIQCSNFGDPRTKDELVTIAAEIRQLRSDTSSPMFRNGKPTAKWVEGFLKRHPQITFRTPESISRAAANVSEQGIRKFFQSLYQFILDNNCLDVLDRSNAWLNIDETSFQFNPPIKRVLAMKGSKNVYKVDSSKAKENLTVTYCFVADGTMRETQIILKNSFSRLQDFAYACGQVNANFVISQTERGWQDKNSFEAYLKKVVEGLDHIQKPIFISLDNHPSHINYHLFKWCREREVHILSLPPNCTHILQVADIAVFKAAKLGWKKETNLWRRNNPGRSMDEIEFVKVLKKMNDRYINDEMIINGFKASGLYPFNVNNVHFERCIGKNYGPSIETATPQNEENNYAMDDSHGEYVEEYLEEYEPVLENEHQTEHELGVTDAIFTQISAHQSHSSLEDDPLKIMEEMKQLNNKLRSCSANLGTDFTFLTLVIDQQLDLMKHQFSSCASEDFTQQTAQAIPSTSKTIKDILRPPAQFERKTNRRFKRANCGILTSDEVIETYEKEIEEKERIGREKEEKKLLRLTQKELREKCKNIKKEKSEKVNVPKKRKTVKNSKIVK